MLRIFLKIPKLEMISFGPFRILFVSFVLDFSYLVLDHFLYLCVCSCLLQIQWCFQLYRVTIISGLLRLP